MIGREPARRPLQASAVQVEVLAKLLVVSGAPPTIGPLDNRLPNPAQRLGVGTPRADRQEALVRRDVNVEAGGVNVACQLVAKLNAGVGLVRFPAAGKSRVAIHPQQRAAHAPIAGHKALRYLFQPRLKGTDEGQTRFQDILLVAPFVRLEPGAVVVVGQFLQELE